VADTIQAERGAAGGMERKSRCIVRTVVLSFLGPAESPAVLYSHSPALQYHFMRRGPCGQTSLSEGRRSPVKPDAVRLCFRILTHALAECPTCRTRDCLQQC
jgi:hypothetical protein